MGLIDRLATHLGYIKADLTRLPAFLRDDAGMQRWRIPDGNLYYEQAELYRRLSWVQAAVAAVSQTAATVDLSVRRRVLEETRDISNHPFELLLQRPNPLDSRFELLEATFAARRLTGNAYWWLNRRGPDSPVVEIWPIPPHQLLPVPDEHMYLRGYAFYPEGMLGNSWAQNPAYLLEPWEIVHFKSYNPINRFVGLSPVEAVAMGAAGDLKMQEWNANFFGENNAKMPGLLAFADRVPEIDWQMIQADVKAQTGGVRRALMMLRNVGKGGVEWVSMAMSQREMEFLQGRQFTREEIFTLFAPGLSSVLDVNATEANATAGRSTFIELSVWPLLCAIAEKISNDVLPVYGRDLIAVFDDIRVQDRELALREQEAFERVHTVDEVRARYYQSAALGDRRGALLPVEIVRGGGDSEPPPGGHLALKRETPEGADLNPGEQALYQVLRLILARYGDEFRDAIETDKRLRYEGLSAELRSALRSALLVAMVEEAQLALANAAVDVEPDQIVTRASAWAERYAGEQAKRLTETTRTAIAHAISSYMRTPGMTREQLDLLLQPAVGARRAESIAVTEITTAASAGVNEMQQLLAEQGIAMVRVWRTRRSNRTCPVCQQLNGKPESVWGKQFPAGPPAHPRCNCGMTMTLQAQDGIDDNSHRER